MKNPEKERIQSESKATNKAGLAILGLIILGLTKFGGDGLRLLLRAHREESAMVKGVKEVGEFGVKTGIKRLFLYNAKEVADRQDSIVIDTTWIKNFNNN